MFFNLRIIEADDAPAMDTNGKCDPYCKIFLSSSPDDVKHTKVCKKTLTPKWNDVFTFNVTNFSSTDQIVIQMKDKDLINSERISYLNLPVIDYQIGKVYDVWMDMTKYEGVPKGGKAHLIIHLSQQGETAFVDTSDKQIISRDIKPIEIEKTDIENSSEVPSKPKSDTEQNHEEEEEIYDDSINPLAFEAEESQIHKKIDYSKYDITLISFECDDIHREPLSEDVGGELTRQMAALGLPMKIVYTGSSTTRIKELFNTIESNPKQLILCVASTASTDKLRIIVNAYNETNFLVPDVDGIFPPKKVIDDLEEGVELRNPIDLELINKSIGDLFKLSSDEDRFIFNYLNMNLLTKIGEKKIGGCVFVETPLIEVVPMQTQVDSIINLINALIDLPDFN